MHEWPLLIFTVCLQAAIGGMFMLAIFYKKIHELGEEKALKVMKAPLIVIIALSIIGLAASFTHLGTPGNAINTIRNLGSSWQSREILVTGLFIGAACLTLGLALVQKKVNVWLVIISTLIGLIDIYCMGAIYANTLVSGWNSINTYTSFFGTVIVLGPVLVATIIIPMLREEESKALAGSLAKYACVISILGVAVQLIGIALFSTTMHEVNMISGNNVLLSLDGYSGAVGLRWIIEVIGIGVLGYMTMSKGRKISFSVAYIALAALFLAEGMSRYVFYVIGA